MVDAILFPSDYFNAAKVDEDLKYEYDSVKNIGLFNIIIFDYDKWFNQGKLALNYIPDKKIRAVYRGWMMKPEVYEKFYSVLSDNNIELVTNPYQYQLMHIFPNIYSTVESDTAKMLIYPEGRAISVEDIKKSFSKFMVKDYVKSVKGTNFPKYFDSSVTQAEFDECMNTFYKFRGELFTGGICIKEYLDLKKYDFKTNEYRVFYINNYIATISPNSGQPPYTNKPPENLIDKYRNLSSPFYTIDYAETEDGKWKVIETGDGQVSGLSEFQNAEAFFRALYRCFE